ncbi:MAG: hypothetical protein KDK65_02820, partial [Chlamydiia bacterium]|nr:hypothetical protein [Chlamydiia bacterium]
VLTTTPFFETRWTERLRRNIACSNTLEHGHRIIGLSLKGLLPQELYTHLYTDLEAVQERLLGDGRSQLILGQPYLPFHLVSDPEQIGSIFAAEALVQQLFDPIEHEWIETLAPDSEYGSPFLLSKAVEGSTLQSKDVKCDPEAFSKQLIIWLLTGYRSEPERLTCLEKYRIDKPHYEVVPHSYEGAFKGFSFENGQLCHQLEDHPLLNMKEMDRPIHDNVRREVLRLPVDLVMLNALTDLIQRNLRAKRVTSFVRVSCYEDAKNMVTEPLAIPAGLFTALSHLYIRMQELLKANKQITHRQLFEQLYPSGPARAERRTYQSPQEAYDMLRGRLKEFGEIVRIRQQLKRGVPFEETPEQFDTIISGIPGILEPLQIHTLPACVRPVLYQTLQSKPVSHLNVASCSDLKEFEKIISTSKGTLRSLNLVGVQVSLTSVLQLQQLEELKLGFQAERQLLLNLPKLRSLELSDMSASTTVKGVAPKLARITVTKCSLLETLSVETHVKGQIVGCPLDTLLKTALELASTPVLSCNDPFKNRLRPILEVEIPCEPQLDLSDLTIGSNEMEVICRLLETRSWSILDFSNCQLMTSALTLLQGKTFPNVTGLNLSGAKGFSESFLDCFPKLYLLYLSHTKVIPSLAAHNELKILHLDHCGLTAQSLEKLQSFFKEHHSLDILNMSHNQLGDAGVTALRKLLLQMHVRHLDLSFNDFSLSTLNASIESLHVDHLDVSGNRCADDAYVPWEVFLRKSMVASLKMHSLQLEADPHLSLLANTFKGRAMRMLSVADNPELFIYHKDEYLDVLMNNLFFKSLSTTIEALNFANTGLDKRGIKMLAAILLHIRSLRELNLSRNQLTPEDLVHLADRTPIIRLRTLDISGNPLSTQEGLNAILKLFHKYLPKLETFICNDLGSSDDLTDFFKQLATDCESHLTTLSLVRCGSLHKRDTLVELRNALHTHPNIHILILDSNNIGKEALKALLTGLPPTIHTLSIRHNPISPADARDWLHLVGSTHLVQLDLSPDMLAPADLPTLHTHLRKNFNKSLSGQA